MLRNGMRAALLGVGVVAASLLAGCASSGGSAKAVPGGTPGTPTTQAVACSQCKITWVKVPITPGGGKSHIVTGYGARKSMECPSCKDAVQNLFTTGRFEHTCQACDGTIASCDAH